MHLHTITRRPPLALTNLGYWLTGKVADDGSEYVHIITDKETNKSPFS